MSLTPHPMAHHPHPHQRLAMTTYYRTISVDNKPTTVIIGPSTLRKKEEFPTWKPR